MIPVRGVDQTILDPGFPVPSLRTLPNSPGIVTCRRLPARRYIVRGFGFYHQDGFLQMLLPITVTA